MTAYNTHRPWGGGGTSAKVAGRIRVDSRHFKNDVGWFDWLGVSDLAAMGYVLSGREDEVWARFDDYARAGRTVVRVLGMLGYDSWVQQGLAFSPRTPGYSAARSTIVAEANRRGLYVEWCLFADAQIVVPDAGEREHLVDEFAAFCRENDGVIPQLANEPFKNGWVEADDPALIALAERFAVAVGHRDFSIGDPVDGDDQDSSAGTTAKLITLSHHSNIVVLHPDRRFSATSSADKRFRRWVDHVEGMTDVMPQLAPGVAYVCDEPIGNGPHEEPGRRDNDPDALAAGQFVAKCCGFAYTFHKIDGEITSDDLKGFYEPAAVLAQIPVSPDWVYLNDSWAGSPTGGMTWSGKEGKLRHHVCGNKAWSIIYGDWASVNWREGWVPTERYRGPRICVWSVNL